MTTKTTQTKPEAAQKREPEVVFEGQEAPKAKPAPEPCLCGCGKTTVTAKARFVAGHDAKLKARLVNAALEAEAQLGRKPTRDEQDSVGWAHAELAALDWTEFLDKSRDARAKKAEAKAAKATRKSGLALTDEEAGWLADHLSEVKRSWDGETDDETEVAAVTALLAKLAPKDAEREQAS